LFETKAAQPTWVSILSDSMPTEIDVESIKRDMMRFVFEFVKRVILTYAQAFT